MQIEIQTGKPTDKGLYAVYCRQYSDQPHVVEWTGKHFAYPRIPTLKWPSVPDKEFAGSADIIGWVGPLPPMPGLEKKVDPKPTQEVDDAGDDIEDLF